MCSKYTCPKCVTCETCLTIKENFVLSELSYKQMLDILARPDTCNLQKSLIIQAYTAKMQDKFNSFKTVYEKGVSGIIHKVSGNFAFLLTDKLRLFFIHINNVRLNSPNVQVKFVVGCWDNGSYLMLF